MGQEVIEMPRGTGGNFRFVGCGSDIFTDSGGQSSSYSSSENGQITFCPVIETDRMVFDFTSIQLGPNDLLRAYDGDSTSSPLITTFSNASIPSAVVSASSGNPTGCLTFTFTSNATDNRAGWLARRSCFNPCQTITTSISTVPPIDADGILRICQGDTVQFDGQATFSDDGTGATYQWDFDNGRGLNPGQSQNETFSDAGSYQARFIATDNTGCTDRELIDLVIQVSNDPDFTGTASQDQEICLGETTTLTGAVETVEFLVTPAPPISGTTFLPDGDGVSYQTCIDVEGFSPGTTFTNASNLISMFINIEHTWTNDLDIILTAPNGTSVEILRAGMTGSDRRLGNSNRNDSSTQPNNPAANPPGVGFEYIIREDAPATGIFQNEIAALQQGSSLPAGSYMPSDPFSNFIGSSLNGRWCLSVTDNVLLDNGYIFEWGLNFDPALLPSDLSFEPDSVREGWQPDPTITATNGNEITVQPDVAGTKCYTYEFEDSFGCVYTQEVCIEVNPLPTPIEPSDLMVCDNFGNTTTIDLTQNTSIMLAGQNAADFQVAYYRQLIDAQSLTNPISNPNQFPAQNVAETIFTSITNAATGCSTVRDFLVSINQAIYTDPADLATCDDASNDGIELFDLSAQTAVILGTQSSAEVTVTYHRTQADAQNDTNAITNEANYMNENSPIQAIYVRVENNIDNTCFDTGEFTLTVGGNPVANPVDTYRVCDDASNDGLATFQLQTRDSEILLNQDTADFEVTYYRSSNDAIQRQNPINKASFQNTGNPQTITARIDSRFNNECFETTTFDLIVDPLPQLQQANALIACDDPSGDGVEVFDLTSNDTTILNGLSPADFEITYYLSQADANSSINPITSPYTSNVASDIIYVRVRDLTTSCFSTTTFEIRINPVPNITSVPILQACDVNTDGTEVFRLNDRLDQIRNGQSGVSVAYYNSQANALSGTMPLDGEAYSSSGLENIFYRSEFTATGCFTTSSFNIETVLPPVAAIPMTVELCDSGDGTATYNLANSDAEIQDGQSNTSVTYYETQANASSGNAAINKNFTFTGDITLFARLENTNTGCFDTTSIDLRFGELPVPQLVEEIVLCRDPQGDLVDGPAVLDTGLSNADFDFEWRFEGQIIPTENDATLITEQQGNYEVTAINSTTGCSVTDSTLVRLAGAPDTFAIDITSEPFALNQQVVVQADGPDDYWFQLDDGLYQDSNTFDNISPGVHIITIAERNGCGSVSTQIFVYGYPKFFTPNFDGFNDTWNVAAGDRLPILNIYIFDRFGKLLKELNPTGSGWDGTYQGELLPSSDYWFKLEYEYDGTTGTANGHFSLKR
ncbi:gliding motility-associated C-terminal domain-containing protein [Nonlabens sp. Hel1_33_55]|nr:gliding motility-associated C-terminal domain-containing protein [Nonlabens sp. Hel1_33_55]